MSLIYTLFEIHQHYSQGIRKLLFRYLILIMTKHMKQVVEININKNSNIIMDIIYTHR